MIAMDRNHRDNRLLLGLENRDSKRSYGSKVSTWGEPSGTSPSIFKSIIQVE